MNNRMAALARSSPSMRTRAVGYSPAIASDQLGKVLAAELTARLSISVACDAVAIALDQRLTARLPQSVALSAFRDLLLRAKRRHLDDVRIVHIIAPTGDAGM